MDEMRDQQGRIIAARRRLEQIIEAQPDGFPGRLVQIEVDLAMHRHGQRAQIVEAMDMIGVGVGQQQGVEPVHAGGDQLLAQVGAGVHQQPRRLASLAALLHRMAQRRRRFFGLSGRTRPSPARCGERRPRRRSPIW